MDLTMTRIARVRDGRSFGFGVFCGEDINGSGARFTEPKNRSETEGGAR